MRLAVRQTRYAPFNQLAFAIECFERLISSKLFGGIRAVTDVSALITGPDKYRDASVPTAPPRAVIFDFLAGPMFTPVEIESCVDALDRIRRPMSRKRTRVRQGDDENESRYRKSAHSVQYTHSSDTDPALFFRPQLTTSLRGV